MSRADERVTTLRGFAWYGFRAPTAWSGDHPFGGPASEPEPGMPLAEPPPGVEADWAVSPEAKGLLDPRPGGGYLILTENPEPPPVVEGWDVEPARLRDDFEMGQRGDRWVRMIRIVGTRSVGGRELQEVELEVDQA